MSSTKQPLTEVLIMSIGLIKGPCIITKILRPTNTKDARVKAYHKRDSDHTWSKTIAWDDNLNDSENHIKAAELLIDSWPLNESSAFVLKGRGHDSDHYYFVAVTIN